MYPVTTEAAKGMTLIPKSRTSSVYSPRHIGTKIPNHFPAIRSKMNSSIYTKQRIEALIQDLAYGAVHVETVLTAKVDASGKEYIWASLEEDVKIAVLAEYIRTMYDGMQAAEYTTFDASIERLISSGRLSNLNSVEKLESILNSLRIGYRLREFILSPDLSSEDIASIFLMIVGMHYQCLFDYSIVHYRNMVFMLFESLGMEAPRRVDRVHLYWFLKREIDARRGQLAAAVGKRIIGLIE